MDFILDIIPVFCFFIMIAGAVSLNRYVKKEKYKELLGDKRSIFSFNINVVLIGFFRKEHDELRSVRIGLVKIWAGHLLFMILVSVFVFFFPYLLTL